MKRITLVLGVLLWAVLGSTAVAQDPLQGALEYNPTNQASTWVNPDTGTTESVVPVRTFANAAGQPCREFQSTIVIGGRKEQGYGTACRQPDGTWRIVSGQATAAPPVEQRTTVYVREAPSPYYAYYPYYPYSYYPSWGYGYPYWYPFSFNFSYVYRDGGYYRGSKYYGGGYHRGGGGYYGGGKGGGGHSKWYGGGQSRGGGGSFSGGQRGGGGNSGGGQRSGGNSKWSGGGSRR